MNNVISGKQCALFCSIMLFSSKLLVLPSLLYAENKAASILSVTLIFALEFLFLIFLINFKKKNKKISFFNFFEQKIGKILTKIILLLLFLFFILKAVYIMQESFSFLKRSLYTEASIAIFLICLLPPVTAFAYKGLKSFGRTLEIFYLVIIALIVFCTLVWLISVKNFSFTILDSGGIADFFVTFYKYTFWFGDLLFLMYILDKVEFTEKTKSQLLRYSGFTMLFVLLFMVVYFITFQTTSFAHPFAILDIIQFVSDFGTVGKFDIIALTAVMFIIYFQIGMLTFCASDCLKKIVPFGHKAQSLIVINFIYVLASYIVFNNANSLVLFYSSSLSYFSIFLVYFVPILFVLFSGFKRGAK